jgi:hypothetical protein
MSSTISQRLLVPGLAAAASVVVLPLLHAQGVGVAQVGESSAMMPRSGHVKDLGCTQKAHERVRALMDNVPWPRFDVRPSARNWPCK